MEGEVPGYKERLQSQVNAFEVIQYSILDNLKKEIDELNAQRRKLKEQTLLSGQLLNSLYSQFLYFVKSCRQTMRYVKELSNAVILFKSHFFVYITIWGNLKDSNDDKNKKEDEQINNNRIIGSWEIKLNSPIFVI